MSEDRSTPSILPTMAKVSCAANPCAAPDGKRAFARLPHGELQKRWAPEIVRWL
jgi:hypothetical protein